MWHSEDVNGCSLSGDSAFEGLLFLYLISCWTLHCLQWLKSKCINVCVCVWQADMMFRSGVFWMGLVFIPVTSLVFDVAYKVWVFSALSSLIITPTHTPCRKFLQDTSYLLKKFVLWFSVSILWTLQNVCCQAADSGAICRDLFPVVLKKKVWVSTGRLFVSAHHVEASVTLQGEEGLFQDSGGRGAGARGFVQRPRSSGAWEEVQMHTLIQSVPSVCNFRFILCICWPILTQISLFEGVGTPVSITT